MLQMCLSVHAVSFRIGRHKELSLPANREKYRPRFCLFPRRKLIPMLTLHKANHQPTVRSSHLMALKLDLSSRSPPFELGGRLFSSITMFIRLRPFRDVDSEQRLVGTLQYLVLRTRNT